MAFVVFGLGMGLSGGVAALDNCTWAWPGVDWYVYFYVCDGATSWGIPLF